MNTPPHPSELREAERYGARDVAAFVERSRHARERARRLSRFYARYPARLGTLHQLAAASIALTRSAAMSEAYHRIGDTLMPVSSQQVPRSEAWERYVRSHDEARPQDYREECWLQAHLEDMEKVRAQGLLALFAEERAAHADDPGWALLEEHMAVTLGTRVADRQALSGELALETALASTLWEVLRRQIRTGMMIVRTYVGRAAAATLFGGPRAPDGLPSDRALVAQLVHNTARLGVLGRTWRIGVRRRARGAERIGEAWSLVPNLRAVLGDEVDQLHPQVYRLFDRMSDFRMTARVHLEPYLGFPAVARVATILLGQGMYESHLEDVDARFRLFRRDDGSLHFVREFWCADEIRVFDSDFVVRQADGEATLVEVFQELGVGARMCTEILDDGGLSMTVVGLWIRGFARSPGPFRVRFTTRPLPDGRLHVLGVMDLAPRGALERFWTTRVLRLPERLGYIEYWASAEATS
ncbi:MAG: hypothetical protein EP330_25620 [Deltaproteobacteria bacterium]|nr:MAG: hypothetical protein EP330_25620 [Deltaproteobacteria bacterium]